MRGRWGVGMLKVKVQGEENLLVYWSVRKWAVGRLFRLSLGSKIPWEEKIFFTGLNLKVITFTG